MTTRTPGISEKSAYRLGRFEVREVSWRRSGKTAVRFPLIRSPSFACVVPITDEGRILLLENLHPVPGLHLLEVPGGRLESGESPREAARREMEEETGWIARRLTPLGRYYPNTHWGVYQGHLFLGERLVRGVTQLDPGESVRPRSLKITDVYRRLHSGRLRGGSTMIALLLAEPVLRRRGLLP